MGSSNFPNAATRGEHASLLRFGLALLAALILPVFAQVVQPGFFASAADALHFTPRVGALAFFISAAIAEEATKAAAIGITDLRRMRFSWFWITFAVAGFSGLLELALRVWMYSGRVGVDVFVLTGIRSVTGHIALSMICVALAQLLRGGVVAWFTAVVVAGAFHSLVNFSRGGMFGVPPGGGLTILIGSFVLFVVVIVVAFFWRSRFDWRELDAA